MNTPYDRASFHSQANNLSERYRQLEGFTDPTQENAAVLTTADVHKESRFRSGSSAGPFAIKSSRNSTAESWTDALVTIVVMVVALVSSSVLLGVAASQLTSATQQLTRNAIQQSTLQR